MILVRVVDRWVGIPLCAALTILRKIAGLTVPDRSRHPVTRVMFLKPAEQGATLLAAPAIANTAER
ncbi:MAG TPA: glycosyltransferase family 9 protein, partial [Candidatus Hydrogenedentes bacterium]|nr:glycosyltransferase family 9 protein [Candidatus Hydrogenedentota bacterium]